MALKPAPAPAIVLQIDALAPQRVLRWIDLGLLPGFKGLREQSDCDAAGPITVSAVPEIGREMPTPPTSPTLHAPRARYRLVADLFSQLMPGPQRIPSGGVSLAWQAVAGHAASLTWSRQLIADLQGWARFCRDWPTGEKPAARLRLRAAETLNGFDSLSRVHGQSFQRAQATLLTYQTYDRIVLAARKLADRHEVSLVVSSSAPSAAAMYWFRQAGSDSRRIAAS